MNVAMKSGLSTVRDALPTVLVATISIIANSQVRAQSALPTPPIGIGDALRQSEETRKSAPLPRGGGPLVLPHPVDQPFTLKDKETLLVRHFVLEGPMLIDEPALREVLAPYENHQLTLVKIYEAADKITTLYRSRGYLVAKAYVPAQDARSGVLKIKIVPGSYGTITLNNQSLVRDSFLRGIIDHGLAGATVIHQDSLERAMLLISDLPGAGMPRVAIGPGRQPETSDFVVSAPEGRRVDGYLLADDFGSPFTGRDRASGGLGLNSLLGIGDRLSASGIIAKDSGLINGHVAYAVPLGYDGLRGEIGASRTTYVLGGIYKDLDATGTADAFTGTLSYPLRRLRDDSIVVSLSYSHKRLNDNVLGVSLADRNIDVGTLTVARDTVGALAGLPLTTSAALSVSTGNVDFPDPTQKALNAAGADTAGNYAKLNLIFNATLAFNDKLSLTTNLKAQKSFSGNLDSSEQMGLTGFWGVRSFDEGLSGDSGFLLTPELKYALPEFSHYRHSVGLFTDIGAVWLENSAYTVLQNSRTQLNDVGLGYYATYEYSPARFLLLKAYVAHTYGSNNGAQSYDQKTKGMVQAGFTF
jgi:hemolysin activation/secretion protein